MPPSLSSTMLAGGSRRRSHSCKAFGLYAIRTASPVLFAVTMGTGSISTLFTAFPYGHGSRPMLIFSLIFFFLNIVIFCGFTILMALKLLWYPEIRDNFLYKPVTSLYLGCFPMGATTIINVAVDVVFEHYGLGGRRFLYFLWATWWINVVLAFICSWIGVHVMVVYQKHSLESMSTVWLLPVVTLIVGSSSGGVVARSLERYSAHDALITLTICAFMVTMGLTLALMMLTIYLLRLIVYGLPPGTSVLSTFLPLGPTGQAGYAIILIGQNFRSLVPIKGSSTFLQSPFSGELVESLCICIAFVLWCLATMWAIYAVLAVAGRLRHQTIAFKSTFWGLVFPNGVYANLTIQLSIIFDSRSFRIVGAIYSVFVLGLWIFITIKSIEMMRSSSTADIWTGDTTISKSNLHTPPNEIAIHTPDTA